MKFGRNSWCGTASIDHSLGETMTSKQDRVSEIVGALEAAAQRATYSAVGGVVGLPARSVMAGLAKSPSNSWVVAKRGGLPTGYAAGDRHPHLLSRAVILSTADELTGWLVLQA